MGLEEGKRFVDFKLKNQDGETVSAYHVLTMVSVHAVPDRA